VNAKLSPGGLVDVEYLVQGLQISHGLEFPALRTTNTLQAIEELAKAKVLTTDEAGSLSAAYRFWRRLIDALRMVRGNARDLTVPAAGTEEFEFLGRRLGGTLSETPWEQEIERQSQVVIDLSRRYEPERPGA
jgi:glutamate-ammonia-ligase adenylyltransferase